MAKAGQRNVAKKTVQSEERAAIVAKGGRTRSTTVRSGRSGSDSVVKPGDSRRRSAATSRSLLIPCGSTPIRTVPPAKLAAKDVTQPGTVAFLKTFALFSFAVR